MDKNIFEMSARELKRSGVKALPRNLYEAIGKAEKEYTADLCDVFLEIEVQGCQKIKRVRPDCISIFIKPPSMEILEGRLRGRGTETEDVIAKRMARAREELLLAEDYDYEVINDDLSDCVDQVRSIIRRCSE